MRKVLGLFFLVMAFSVATVPAHAGDRGRYDYGWFSNCDPVSAPEPGTFALLASGMGALAMFRRSFTK